MNGKQAKQARKVAQAMRRDTRATMQGFKALVNGCRLRVRLGIAWRIIRGRW